MKKVLTDTLLKALKAPTTGRSEIADLRCAGLTFRVTAKDARSWSFRFRDPKTGKTTRKGLGSYPDVSLGGARAAADKARKVVAAGHNPVEAERKERQAAPSRTFNALADKYLTEHAERHKRSAAADKRNLQKHVRPKWGRRDYREIRRGDLVALVEGLIKEGKQTLANRVHSLCVGVFSFAVESDLLETNPLSKTPKRGAEKTGNRVLSDAELRLFWPRIVLRPVTRTVGLALRLALLTAARPSEAAELDTAELMQLMTDTAAAWVLPGARSKNKRAHLVPLSPLALDTVKAAVELAGDESQFLFPSPTRRRADGAARPITGHALSVAMARFAESLEGNSAAVRSWKANPPTPHDLRRTVGTRLAELRVPKEIRDRCLNHTPTDVGSKHYDLYDYQDEKRDALNRWAIALGTILSDASGGVVSLKAEAQ